MIRSPGASLALKAFNLGVLLIIVVVGVALGLTVQRLRAQQERTERLAVNLEEFKQSQEPATMQEMLFLNTPVDATSEAVFRAHLEKIDMYAYETDRFEVDACAPEFVLMKVSRQKPLVIQNNDAFDQHIWIGKDQEFIIPAKRAIEIEPKYAKTDELIAVSCNRPDAKVALIRLLP